MAIRILTDSAADMPKPYDPRLTVLPMTITFGERTYQDNVDLSHRQFYELLVSQDALPKTSQINPERFTEAFRDAVEAGDQVIAITLSSKLSGTYQSACIAAEDFAGNVCVVDSENASIGESILVRRALELLEQSTDIHAIAAQLSTEKKDIRLVALLDTLEFLKRGGRLSQSAAFVGGLLSIKPVIAVVGGEVVLLGKARGSKNGNNLLVQEIEKTGGIDFSRPFTLGYNGFSTELLEKYIADSQALWKEYTASLPYQTIGGTIGTHVGPGVVAVSFFQKI